VLVGLVERVFDGSLLICRQEIVMMGKKYSRRNDGIEERCNGRKRQKVSKAINRRRKREGSYARERV
jgi:hypothetical protein